jgi:hypothetical protein
MGVRGENRTHGLRKALAFSEGSTAPHFLEKYIAILL